MTPREDAAKLEGYYIEFFNLLMFNKVRLTFKYALLKDNPSKLSNIQSKIIENLVSEQEDTNLIFGEVPLFINDGETFYSTEASDGLNMKSGYTFGVTPTNFKEVFLKLKREDRLNR